MSDSEYDYRVSPGSSYENPHVLYLVGSYGKLGEHDERRSVYRLFMFLLFNEDRF
jgi:hypothetical protein